MGAVPLLQVKSCDTEACILLGYSREAVKGQPILSLLKPLGKWQH